MKKTQILMSVTYSGNNKYWNNSYIKNKVFSIDPDKDIHNQIAEIILDNDFTTLTYKNKPTSNIFQDMKDGSTRMVGYVYRCKTDIQHEDYTWHTVYFDCWVELNKVSEYGIIDVFADA